MSGIYTTREICKNHFIASGATERFEIPISAGSRVSIQMRWHDGTSAFTATFETTNQPRTEVASASTTAGDWSAEAGVTLVGAPGGAAGSSMKHLSEVASLRGRIVVVASADTRLSIFVHGKE